MQQVIRSLQMWHACGMHVNAHGMRCTPCYAVHALGMSNHAIDAEYRTHHVMCICIYYARAERLIDWVTPAYIT